MTIDNGQLTVRKKLIEVLKTVPFEGKILDQWWFEEKIATFADHLIANGVTFVEESAAFGNWNPVTEQLPIFYPGRRRSVLVTLEDHDGKRLVTTAKYFEEFGEWGEFKDYRYQDFKVLAWMPKPERYGGS